MKLDPCAQQQKKNTALSPEIRRRPKADSGILNNQLFPTPNCQQKENTALSPEIRRIPKAESG
eukprot:713679-Ditylum_brightwellii.AAC.1